jgi:hypothetical protein
MWRSDAATPYLPDSFTRARTHTPSVFTDRPR